MIPAKISEIKYGLQCQVMCSNLPHFVYKNTSSSNAAFNNTNCIFPLFKNALQIAIRVSSLSLKRSMQKF